MKNGQGKIEYYSMEDNGGSFVGQWKDDKQDGEAI